MYEREQDLEVKVALVARNVDESAARFTGQESEGDSGDEPFTAIQFFRRNAAVPQGVPDPGA